ncbi:hypothetical protein [Acinetobacter sp.]|uniref:hypothetical protein n=1 Tax=Acinetobacter sp. TaxID=472 RepID=UPI00388EEF20
MIVVDHDGLSEEELVDEIKFSLTPSVTGAKHESQEIEWENDDNPFNYRTEIPAAAAELFGKE